MSQNLKHKFLFLPFLILIKMITRIFDSQEKSHSNISIIEHPHGGLIMTFIAIDVKGNQVVYLTNFKSDVKGWEEPSIIPLELNSKNKSGSKAKYNSKNNVKNDSKIDFANNSDRLSHVTYLDLHGNLQIIYCFDKKILKLTSTNYGKTWNEPTQIDIFTFNLEFKNQPIFTQFGKILLPVFNLDVKRSFILISSDFGKTWFPSTYMEMSDEIDNTNKNTVDNVTDSIKDNNSNNQTNETKETNKIEHYNDSLTHCGHSPVLIHQGEIKITAFLQSSNMDNILSSDSTDAGETWGEIYNSKIHSSNMKIDAIRLRDKEGNYQPNILLLFVEKEKKTDKEILKIAISNDNCETWNKEIIIDTGNMGDFTDPTLIQCANGLINIAYGYQNEMIKNIEMEFQI